MKYFQLFTKTGEENGNQLKKIQPLVMVLFFTAYLSVSTGCGSSSGGSSSNAKTTYTVSGTIIHNSTGLEGVTVTLTGISNKTATTGSSGAFSFTGLSNGTYTVTPGFSGYTFADSSTTVIVSGDDITDIDFTGTAVTTYILSGTVSGDKSENITVTLSGDSTGATFTDSGGNYSFFVMNGTYTVTPVYTGYTFADPDSSTSTSVTVSGSDVSDVDFTSTAVQIGDRTDYSSVTLSDEGTYSSSDSGVTKQYAEYTSTTKDTPALKVAPGGSMNITNSKITKNSGTTSSTENSGFYGFNSGVLASSSADTSSYSSSSASSITITDCTITTGTSGANGAFAFGENAVITLDHVTINTTGDSNSRGVDATYGGTIKISNSIISTTGGSCAALATDRYESASAPKVIAENCTGTTSGNGSPGIYCTGTFTVTDCTLSATGSEAACIEGKNSITLNNSSISGVNKWGVIIYQSMSGDSTAGTGQFIMTGGTLTNTYASGPAFFVCDTAAVITLDSATINNSSTMLLVAGQASTASGYISNVNSDWGTLGGTVTFSAANQVLAGSIIICDNSSSLSMTLSSSSTLNGTINSEKNSCTITLAVDSTSSWTSPSSSYLTSLTGVVLSGSEASNVDVADGYTVHCTSMTDSSSTSHTSGTYTTASGGTIVCGSW